MATPFRVRSFKVSWTCACDEKTYNGFNVSLCVSGEDPVNNPIKIIYVRPIYRADGNYSYTFRHNLVQVGTYDVWVQAVSFGKDSFWRSAGGIEIPDDEVGTVGDTPLIFRLISSSPVIFKNSESAETSGQFTNIKIFGKKTVGNSTSDFGFITFTGEGDVEPTLALPTPFTTNILNTSVKSNFTAKLYDTTEKTTLLDIMEIPVVFRGATGKAITVVLSNGSHTIPCSNLGAPTSYALSGTNLFVYEGNTALAFTTGTLSNGTFSVTRTSENISFNPNPTIITVPAKGVFFPAASGMTPGVEVLTAKITYTIIIKASTGETTTITKDQVFSKSLAGTDGEDGDPGTNGYSASLVHLYQRKATSPVKPTANITFAFTTATFTGITEGWSKEVPAVNGSPLWVITASAADQGISTTIVPASWSTPVKMTQDGINGVDGLNSATVYLYKRAFTTPTKPNFPTTYAFTTGLLSGTGLVESDWTQTIPESDNNPLWVTLASASSTTTTDTINSAEWTTPVIMAQDVVSYFLTASTYAVKKATTGVFTPTSVRFSGKQRIGNSNPTNYSGIFKLYRNGSVSPFYTTSTTESYKDYTILAADTSIVAEFYSGTALLDSTTCAVIFDGTAGNPGSDGADSIFTILSNEAHSIPCDSSGVPTSYVGSGTIISVYEGTTKLTHDGLGISSGKYNVTTVATNISAGTKTTSVAGDATYGNHSGISSSIDTSSINYTISGKRQGGTSFSIVKTQSFSKSKTGTKGDPGNPGSAGAPAVTGILTNEFHGIPCSSTGTPISFVGAQTDLSVFVGSIDDSANWTYSVVKTNVTCLEASTSKIQTVTGITSDIGYIDITASKTDQQSITKRFTVSKTKQGVTGADSSSYWITRSAAAIKLGTNGNYTPASVTFNGFKATGTSAPVAYAGRFKILTSVDGTTYTVAQTTADVSSVSYTIPAGIKTVKVQFYLAGGTTTLLDEEVIPVVSDGINGTNGFSTTMVQLYQRGTSAPTKPTSNIVFSFSDYSFTGINNGWSKEVPAVNGSPLWVITASVSNQGSSVTIPPTAWSSQIKILQDGADGTDGTDGTDGVDGLNCATVTLYQRKSTQPTNPTFSTTYDFSTAVLSAVELVASGWTQSIPPTNGNPLWVTIASSVSQTSTDTIASTEWSTPIIFSQDGSSATSYFLTASSYAVKKSVSGVFTPTAVRFRGKQRVGNSVAADFYGIIKLYRNGSTTAFYTSSVAEYYKDYSVLSADTQITAELYDSSSNLLDTTSFSVVYDGTAGSPGLNGVDSIFGILSNEACTIPCDSSGVPSSYVGSGTTIFVYEGTTKLTHDGAGAIAGKYNVTATVSGITAGTKTTTDGNAVYNNHSGITSGTATITYTVSGMRLNGTPFNITKIQSFSKVLSGATGAAGRGQFKSTAFIRSASAPTVPTGGSFASPLPTTPTGWSDGIPTGTNPLYMTTRIFTDDELSPQQSTWTAPQLTSSLGQGTKIQFSIDGSTSWHDTPAITDQYMRTGVSTDGGQTWTYSGSTKIKGETGVSGVNAITVIVSNEAHVIPCDSAGTPTSYVGSGTIIRVFEGTNQLSYDGSGTVNSSWDVVGTGTSITVGSKTDSGVFVTINAHSGMTADTASILYTITGKRSDGTSFSIEKTQSFSKSKTGVKGDPGNPGADSTAYWITRSIAAIQKTSGGTYTTPTVTFYGRSATGTSAPVAYAGRFKISTSVDGSVYTTSYTSSADETSKTYTIPAGIKTLKVQFYLAGGTTTLLDEEVIPVVSDGTDGTAGTNGTNGVRGAGIFYAVTTSAVWSDTVANNRITAVTGSSTKIVGDTATETYGSPATWVLTKIWNGTDWGDAGTVIDGNLLVTGSVQAAKIDTRSLTIKNTSGATRASIDGTGNLLLSGDIFCSGGDLCSPDGTLSIRAGVDGTGGSRATVFKHDYTDLDFAGAVQMRAALLDSSGNATSYSTVLTLHGASATSLGIDGMPLAHSVQCWIKGARRFGVSDTRFVTSVPITSTTLTASRALVSDANKAIISSSTTTVELGYLSGTTSNVQSQLNELKEIPVTENWFRGKVTIGSGGVSEIGRYLDFHHTNETASDYSTRLHTNGVDDGQLFINAQKIWHSGNVGVGSGLNADLLDGLEATAFLRSDANDSAAGKITFSGGMDCFSVSDTPTGNSKIGRSTTQYIEMHGGSSGNYISHVCDPTNTKPLVIRFFTTDALTTPTQAWTFDQVTGGFTSKLVTAKSAKIIADSGNSGLEIGDSSVTGSAFIDLKNGFNTDYDVRFISTLGDAVNPGKGALLLHAEGGFTVNGGVTSSGTITGSLFNLVSGGGFQGLAADTAINPSFTWTGDTSTGFYRAGAGKMAFTSAGSYVFYADTTIFGSVVNLAIIKNNPWLTLDSPATGDNGDEQAAGISIGEGGYKGGAALHITYTGDGWSHIGMGAVVDSVPTYEVMKMHYQSKNVTFLGNVTGTFIGNGSLITDLDAGSIAIGTISSDRLPFYPVQQGGGASQLNNKIYMGWSADSKLRVQVDSADFASTWPVDISGNAATATSSEKIGTYLPSITNTINTVAIRNASGDIFARFFRSEYADQASISGAMAFRVTSTVNGDNYIRFCSDTAAIRTYLGVPTTSHTHDYLPLTGGNLSGNVTVSSITPTFTLTETDTTTSARIILSGGTTYLQAGAAGAGTVSSSGDFLFSGYGGANVGLFRVKVSDSYQSILHTGSALDGTKITGVVPIGSIPTGNTSTTVSLGNHVHSYLPLSGGTMTGAVNMGGKNLSGADLITCTGYIRPETDNTGNLGFSSYRWQTVYAATGTINTSDARKKTDVVGLSDQEKLVAVELSKRVGMFKFLDAIAEKGDGARWHIGMTVQDVADVFVAHGLDPWQYGFMCYDSWDADEETLLGSGDSYGFRSSELLLFIAAGINERLLRLENI